MGRSRWASTLARRVGDGLGRVESAWKRLLRKHPITDAGDRAVKFRSDTITVVERRWLPLTGATLLSHLALFLVLLLSLRKLGVSASEFSAAEAFAGSCEGISAGVAERRTSPNLRRRSSRPV